MWVLSWCTSGATLPQVLPPMADVWTVNLTLLKRLTQDGKNSTLLRFFTFCTTFTTNRRVSTTLVNPRWLDIYEQKCHTNAISEDKMTQLTLWWSSCIPPYLSMRKKNKNHWYVKGIQAGPLDIILPVKSSCRVFQRKGCRAKTDKRWTERKGGPGWEGGSGRDKDRHQLQSPTRGAVVLSSGTGWDKVLPPPASSSHFSWRKRKKEGEEGERGEEMSKWEPDTRCTVAVFGLWAMVMVMSQILLPFHTFYRIFICLEALFFFMFHLFGSSYTNSRKSMEVIPESPGFRSSRWNVKHWA